MLQTLNLTLVKWLLIKVGRRVLLQIDRLFIAIWNRVSFLVLENMQYPKVNIKLLK